MDKKVPLEILAHQYRDKAKKALELFLHSARKVPPFKFSVLKTPEDLEPYDALAGRFERAIELTLNPLLKSIEFVETGSSSETIRDKLNFAAKLDLIDDVELWLEMRAARNRIAHEYLPEQIEIVQDLLRTRYREEIEKFLPRLEKYFKKRGVTP
ncbi:MAG: nucleotidyltransferase substrate binding protein [Elusimicrobia bacterium]|nr:nucleotidyltransferase substrate binding protein [Elusimicrobiota bacterium]